MDDSRHVNKVTRYILNGSALAATSLLLRGIGVAWNAFLTARLGAAGLGLISLTMSVYMLAVTFATSAIGFAATKLVAESMARGEADGERGVGVMRDCVCHALITGSTACLALTLSADYVGSVWLGDARTILSLRLLAVSLPAIAVSSALSGYFTAIRKVYKNAVAQLLEQFVKLTVTAAALTVFAPPGAGLEYMCAIVVGGASLAEGASLAFNALLYLRDPVRRAVAKQRRENHATKSGFSVLLAVTIPISVSAYARSALVTLEHILVPRGLQKSGAGYESALASYGVLHGMVMPIVLLPSSVLYAYSSLLVPELAEAKTKCDYALIRRIITRAFLLALVFSMAAAAVMAVWARDLGVSVYGSEEAGAFIRTMAPLVPVMYLDTVIDCVLKGLGEQVYSMKVNILDSAVSALLVWLLLPGFGVSGYIAVIYIAELLNAALSIARAACYASAGGTGSTLLSLRESNKEAG